MRTEPLNRGAVVADQADVLNWRDVNDALHCSTPAFSRICHEIGAFGNIDDRGLAFAVSHAQAQMTPPSTAGARAKPVTTVPIRPALQKPEDTAKAMGQAERLALQSDLAWVGQYNGAITGDVSERMVNAIKEFQKSRGARRPACSIRRSAACWPTPPGKSRKASAGRSYRSRHRRAARDPHQTGAAAGQRR